MKFCLLMKSMGKLLIFYCRREPQEGTIGSLLRLMNFTL